MWEVTPEHLHPVTRSEDFMEPWVDGWLAFECATEKRRLAAPYPARWHEYDATQMEAMLRAAAKCPIRFDPAELTPPGRDADRPSGPR